MKEILYSYTDKYAEIRICKNYSHYPDNNRTKTVFFNAIYTIDLYKKDPANYFNNSVNSVLLFNDVNYVSNDANYVSLPSTKVIKTYSDKKIKRHYANPFAEVYIKTHHYSVHKKGDKLIITSFYREKNRDINRKYYRIRYNKKFISFDLKTKNFKIIGDTNKGNKRKNKFFTTNNFKYLFNSLHTLTQNASKDVIKSINEAMIKGGLEFFDLNNVEKTFTNYCELFVDHRKIKVPNNYDKLISTYYPTEKFLKKNKRNLVHSILDSYGIKSKSIIKLVNNKPNNVNIINIFMLSLIFGEDYYKYISRLNEEIFYDKYPSIYKTNYERITKEEIKNNSQFLTKEEKSNIVSYINSFTSKETSYAYSRTLYECLNLLFDHIKMMINLRVFYDDIKFKARTDSEFSLEHESLTKKINRLRKGCETKYFYGDRTLNEIESDIIAMKNDDEIIVLKPYILKTDGDYESEGNFMHHCVSTYIGYDKSIIISLRTQDDMDRVTCEYDVATGKCKQTRHFYNGRPPKYFEHGLEVLGIKVSKLARLGILHWHEKRKVPIEINGVKLNEFKDETKLVALNELDIDFPF